MILEKNQNNQYNLRSLLSLSGRDYQKYNLLKFRVICGILDYTAMMNGLTKQIEFSEAKIISILENNHIIIPDREGRADFNMIIAEMVMMGLISQDGDCISMLPYSIEAYQKQTFHTIYASLLAAEDSRTLSKRTLFVSALAVVIALISIWLTY